jgi:hypothetical protein
LGPGVRAGIGRLRHAERQWLKLDGDTRRLFDLTTRATVSIWALATGYLNRGEQGKALPGYETMFAKGRFWDGVLDEARVLNQPKDAHWIKLDYESQREGSRLVSFGPVEPRPPPRGPGASERPAPAAALRRTR